MKSQVVSITFLVYPDTKESRTTEPTEVIKQSEEESRGSRTISHQILRSNLWVGAPGSAFSIYNPDQNMDEIQGKSEKDDQQGQEEIQDSVQCPQLENRKTPKDRKQLNRLETKNLNRFFRSKINEMLRDIKQNPQNKNDQIKATQLLNRLNESNKIMFSEMREVIKDCWLKEKLLKCESTLLRYVHRGKMGMTSKLVMLKYFNKILKAIKSPDNFTCWK